MQYSTLELQQLNQKVTDVCSATKKKKWIPVRDTTKTIAPNHQTNLKQLSKAFFWERRNILLQLLGTGGVDDSVLIKAQPKKLRQASLRKRSQNASRSSIYRGVSKNKSKWQVMIMGNFKKMYFGAIKTEQEAASLYDKMAIISHGIQARTNFSYTRCSILDILNDRAFFESEYFN